VDFATAPITVRETRIYSGAVLFGLATAVTLWVRNSFRSLNYFDLFVLVPFWSLLAAVWCSLLVLPMGYVAQRAMRWAAGQEGGYPTLMASGPRLALT